MLGRTAGRGGNHNLVRTGITEKGMFEQRLGGERGGPWRYQEKETAWACLCVPGRARRPVRLEAGEGRDWGRLQQGNMGP